MSYPDCKILINPSTWTSIQLNEIRNRFEFNGPLTARRHWVVTDNVSMFAHTNRWAEADYLLDDYLCSLADGKE
ncbi:MAG: hypothetical protein WCF03_05855 [Nitrososphaeraceae archaeon]